MPLKPYHLYQLAIISFALLLSISTTSLANEEIQGEDFSYKILSESMKSLAGQTYTTPLSPLNEKLSSLDYDQHRAIRYRPEQALWKDINTNLELQAFHPGWLFKNPVNIYTVKDGKAQNNLFSSSDFEYRKPLKSEEYSDIELPGVAGFRLHYPINRPDYLDELVSYLGASYFRALGRNNVYGLSARGLAINTGTSGPEEFPVFTNFYIQEPTNEDETIKVWASMESESLTGAYEFELAPGKETIIDVTAKLYFRKDIDQLGIAPLTSMYLFGENDRLDFDDFRPEVHDSDGLAILREDGHQSWRPLRNPSELAFSFFAENNPQGFGLLQRDREFTNYEDQEADYHRRPSLWITPTGDWGRGSVTLVEIPSDLEGNDNIVAFWVPKKKAKAGAEMTFKYRMHWGSRQYIGNELANVMALRSGQSGVAGVELSEESEQQRKFVVDFHGDYIKNLPADAEVTAKVNAINAKPVTVVVQRIYHTGHWRAIVDMERLNEKTAELSVQLMLGDTLLSEKMLYQWSKND